MSVPSPRHSRTSRRMSAPFDDADAPSSKRQKYQHSRMASDATTYSHGLVDHELHGARIFPSGPPPHFRNQPETVDTEMRAEELSTSVPLQIKRLSPTAYVPTRGSAFAAGYDLYASETSVVPGRGKAMVSTGIAIAIPPGTCQYHSTQKLRSS